MATAVSGYELDDAEIEALVPLETESTALVLAGTVAIDKITDSPGYLRVAAAGSDAAANIKSIEALFEPICQQRHARWKKATATRAERVAPFEQVKKKASALIGAYDVEQERLRRAQEARLQEELRKQAEADAKCIADERAIEDAIRLEAEGDKAGAEAVLNHPVPVRVETPTVILERQVPKTEKAGSRGNWKFRIVDAALVPEQYKICDEKAIGAVVRALKGKTVIPGVEVFEEHGANFYA